MIKCSTEEKFTEIGLSWMELAEPRLPWMEMVETKARLGYQNPEYDKPDDLVLTTAKLDDLYLLACKRGGWSQRAGRPDSWSYLAGELGDWHPQSKPGGWNHQESGAGSWSHLPGGPDSRNPNLRVMSQCPPKHWSTMMRSTAVHLLTHCDISNIHLDSNKKFLTDASCNWECLDDVKFLEQREGDFILPELLQRVELFSWQQGHYQRGC